MQSRNPIDIAVSALETYGHHDVTRKAMAAAMSACLRAKADDLNSGQITYKHQDLAHRLRELADEFEKDA